MTASSGIVAFAPIGTGGNLVLVNGTQTWRNDSSNELQVSAANSNRGTAVQVLTTDDNGTGSTLVIDGPGPVLFLRPITGDVGREISVVKEGSGLLTLGRRDGTTNMRSTFSGGFTLKGGTVALNDIQAVGRSTFTIDGGTITNTSGSAVTISNTNAQVWNGDFGFVGSNALNLGTGMVTLGAAPTVTVSSTTLTVGGTITGGFGLTKAGEGTLRLTATANTFSGTTRIDAGILDVNNRGQALRNTVVDLSGSGTLANLGTAPVFGGLVNYSGFTLPGTVTRLTLNPQEGQIQTYDVLPGGGTATIGLTKSGPGTMIFNGTSTWSGTTQIGAGVLQVDWLAAAGQASPLGTSGTFTLGNGTAAGTLRYTGTGHSTNRAIQLSGSSGGGGLDASGSGAVTFTSGVTAAAGAKTFTLTGTSTATNSIGPIAGVGVSIDKTGPGLWRLSGTSSFDGRLTVSEGTIVAAVGMAQTGSGVFGAGTADDVLPVVGDATAEATGQAAILLESGVLIGRGLVIASLESGATQEAILGMASSSGTATFTGGMSIRLGRDLTLQAAEGGTVRFANQWRDSANEPNPAVEFNVGSAGNSGTVVFGSLVPHAITAVNVRRGTLRLDGGTETMGFGTPVTLGEAGFGGTLDVNGITQSLSSLSFTGVGSTASGAGTLRLLNPGGAAAVNVTGTGHTIATALALDDAASFNVATGGRLGISSVIATGSTGAQSLTKSGPGILELSGANTYSGDTTVSGGTLIVNGSLGAGALTVATNAILMGSGTIGGAATILGAHSPGNSPGIETFNAGLTYSGGSSQVIWELWGNTTTQGSPTAIYDQINVVGNLHFADPTILSLDFGGSGFGEVNWSNSFWDTNQSWTLFDVTGTTSGFDNFTLASAPSAWLDSNGLAFSASSRSANSFRVAQQGTDVMVEYVIVPEPGGLVLAALGLAAAAYAARAKP